MEPLGDQAGKSSLRLVASKGRSGPPVSGTSTISILELEESKAILFPSGETAGAPRSSSPTVSGSMVCLRVSPIQIWLSGWVSLGQPTAKRRLSGIQLILGTSPPASAV